jgi:hypothetical protein
MTHQSYAAMFRTMAERIEAGEAYDAVLRDYGVNVGSARVGHLQSLLRCAREHVAEAASDIPDREDQQIVKQLLSDIVRPGSGSAVGYTHEMTDDDHRAFAETVRELAGMVMVSGYACDLYDQELFVGWTRIPFAAHADGARDRVEVLWLNKSAAARTGQGRLIA